MPADAVTRIVTTPRANAGVTTTTPPWWRRALRLQALTTPLLVLVAVASLAAWVNTRELDSIEERVLQLDQVLKNTWEHLRLTSIAVVLILVIAIPLGILLTRTWARWLNGPVLTLANIGQAAPALGILVLLSVLYGIGFKIALIALVVSAVLPVLRNTIVGIDGVDASLIESARGMGMNSRQVLWRVELPMAVPVVLAGLRTAVVLSVGVATLATFVNAGGLGDIIVAGIKLQRTPILVVGGVLTAAIALFLDWVAGVVEEVVRPRGI